MIAVELQQGTVSLAARPVPSRAEGHALIRMRHAGICSTDLQLQRGYYNFSGTPGHEFVGEVVACGDEKWLGRLVAGEINLACNDCDWCRRGLRRHCPNRTVLGIVKHPGAFAEFLTLPECNLHALPDGVPAEMCIFIEPLAAACEILDQVAIPAGATVGVLGDGKLGLLVAQVLRLSGLQVHLFGRHVDKMRLLEPLGIGVERANGALPRMAYDYVVDATGSASGLEAAIAMTRPRGTLILKSTVHGAVTIDTAAVIVHEITLVGSRCGRFEAALQFLLAGRLILAPLIHDRFPLRQAPAAFARAAEKGVLKVLLENE
ncbi:MAG: alcohol dehydrogenase catalytic domain-containing protein [Candidatus Solibacter usitatus]|nr:alcohol dehydrogenase catalytic domain-containing protein [Candidatus Solibacter usitatus]